MIIVTGANGQLGSGIVEELLTRVPPDRIGVSVRDTGHAQHFADRGVRVRHGDFTDPASLTHAFEDATQVLIVSVNALGDTAVEQHRTAIRAARDAGARRILYTSHVGANPACPFPPMPDHAATEQLLRESGVPFTALRHGFYADTLTQLLEPGVATGNLAVPEDGPVSWTTRGDLAAVDAAILAEEGVLDGITPPLTAPSAPTFDQVAAIASETLGRTVRRIIVPDTEWTAGLVQHAGMPEAQARMVGTIFAASRRGDFAAHGPDLERLLGRPAASVRDVIAAHFAPDIEPSEESTTPARA